MCMYIYVYVYVYVYIYMYLYMYVYIYMCGLSWSVVSRYDSSGGFDGDSEMEWDVSEPWGLICGGFVAEALDEWGWLLELES